MTLIWKGDKVYEALKADTRKKCLTAALLIEAAVKSLLKLGGRTSSGKVTYRTRTGRKRTKTFDPSTGDKPGPINSYRSKPGEPPRVQTGTLRRGFTHWLHPWLPISRVGTNVYYGKYLEFGTRRMAPRPFLRPAMLITLPLIKAMFSKKLDMSWGAGFY